MLPEKMLILFFLKIHKSNKLFKNSICRMYCIAFFYTVRQKLPTVNKICLLKKEPKPNKYVTHGEFFSFIY